MSVPSRPRTNEAPAGDKTGGRVHAKIAVAESPVEAIVSIRFPTGLTLHYSATSVLETEKYFRLIRDGEKTVATVCKDAAFVIETEFPIAIENSFTEAEKQSEIFRRNEEFRSQIEADEHNPPFWKRWFSKKS